jgi:hypothetical protein
VDRRQPAVRYVRIRNRGTAGGLPGLLMRRPSFDRQGPKGPFRYSDTLQPIRAT